MGYVFVWSQYQFGKSANVIGADLRGCRLQQRNARIWSLVRQHQAGNDFMLDRLGQQGQTHVYRFTIGVGRHSCDSLAALCEGAAIVGVHKPELLCVVAQLRSTWCNRRGVGT